MPFFEALYADPARLKQFLGAMTGLSHGANLAIAGQFPWQDHETFVDLGTAQGDLAVQIVLANDHLTVSLAALRGAGVTLSGDLTWTAGSATPRISVTAAGASGDATAARVVERTGAPGPCPCSGTCAAATRRR